MRQNRITTTAAALDALTKAIGGATTNGPTIGLKQNDTASLTAKKEAMIVAEATLDSARAELRTRQRSYVQLTGDAIAFVTLTRDLLKSHFGTSYSTAWDEVGFVGTLKVPRSPEDVKFKLQKISVFLAANPDAGIPQRNITATHAQSLLDDLIAKQNALNSQQSVVGMAVKARKAALKKVAAGISNLVSELKGLVEPIDMVYLSFGLNRPGAVAVPEVPENVSVTAVNETQSTVKWEPSPRADHYRVWLKVDGIDTNPRHAGSPTDPDFMLEQLPPNATAVVAVSAVNTGGESMLSAWFRIGEGTSPSPDAAYLASSFGLSPESTVDADPFHKSLHQTQHNRNQTLLSSPHKACSHRIQTHPFFHNDRKQPRKEQAEPGLYPPYSPSTCHKISSEARYFERRRRLFCVK